MKNKTGKSFIGFLLMLAILPTSIGYSQANEPTPPKEMSLWQTQRIVALAIKWSNGGYHSKFGNVKSGSFDTSDLRFSANEIVLQFKDNKGTPYHIKLDLLAPGNRKYEYLCAETDCKGYKQLGPSFYLPDDTNPTCSQVSGYERAICQDARKWYNPAIDELRRRAAIPASATDFHRLAAAWRALTAKPAIAEAAHIQRLLAEEAVSQKLLDEALNHYELGVEADPTWAVGWHNAALLAGELGYYADAAHHIQNYLELMPDADDAQAARDNLDIWKYKAAH